MLEMIPAPAADPLPPTLPLRDPVPLTDNARTVLLKRYVRRGPDGRPVETPEEMFRRVARAVAAAETELGGDAVAAEGEFLDLLTQLRFFPNSPTFTGAGTPLGQLAACFVLPISDDMGRDPAGIFQTLRDAALIQQTGGGNGFGFSRLRPRAVGCTRPPVGPPAPSASSRCTTPPSARSPKAARSMQGPTWPCCAWTIRTSRPSSPARPASRPSPTSNISVGVADAFMVAVRDDGPWSCASRSGSSRRPRLQGNPGGGRAGGDPHQGPSPAARPGPLRPDRPPGAPQR